MSTTTTITTTATATTVKPRLFIIGAGSRGHAYARAALDSGLAEVTAVAEPNASKRRAFGERYIWGRANPKPGAEYSSWQSFIAAETRRRQQQQHEDCGFKQDRGDEAQDGRVDAVFVCVPDRQHIDVLLALAPLNLHIMSEKPLATTLQDCLRIQQALSCQTPERIFAIGHVLRYSPHNMLLRHLVRERRVIGEVLSIEHTEPVGWWHFAHSYVRGNWRREGTSAPSILTKCCHDVDFLLWMLCSPVDGSREAPHLPARVSSSGSLKQFRRARKPRAAGAATTNCMTCPLTADSTCEFSAWKIYHDRHLARGITAWPLDVVNPALESILQTRGLEAAAHALRTTLSEDYVRGETAIADIEDRGWYGRCVYESDNDVCDDQFVVLEWDDDSSSSPSPSSPERGPKTAALHMIAQTHAQCERRGRIYGTRGEISYDSETITVHTFSSSSSDTNTETFRPRIPPDSHHGGGDAGLTTQFLKAVIATQEQQQGGGMSVAQAQREFLGVTVQEVVRSHEVCFRAEESRVGRRVVELKGLR
jgi:predicted dehydrogenase